jgi:hypothetical protein
VNGTFGRSGRKHGSELAAVRRSRPQTS